MCEVACSSVIISYVQFLVLCISLGIAFTFQAHLMSFHRGRSVFICQPVINTLDFKLTIFGQITLPRSAIHFLCSN